MTDTVVENLFAQTVKVMEGKNPRQLYPHQIDAIQKLNELDKQITFSTLVVLPTGGGKTRVASTWLLSAAIDKNVKVLWIAHRHLLLEQAADSFIVNAYSEKLLNQKFFKYRIVSGQHNKPTQIKPDDNILIISKDSLATNLKALDSWLEGEEKLYFVIDEAHHAIARSYKKIIDHIQGKNLKLKILGLTATPFRTSEKEKGLLGKIFSDGSYDARESTGMVYRTSLNTLIKRGILSTPHCETCDTQIMLGDELGLDAIKSITQFDSIPEDIAEHIAKNAGRNRFIVDTYFGENGVNYKRYGQTLVFALNKVHAFALHALFEQKGKKYGVKAGFIVSGTSAEFTGIDVSNKHNEEQIEAFKNGEIQVLINVNILTEGADLPKTQTVFLTRPTVSTVLMTQMVGRALRGELAGGTKEAYIVSFVDKWNDKIAWVVPESILEEEVGEWPTDTIEYKKQNIRLISIEKIEEFARIMDTTVDTSLLESIAFEKRIPLGMYVFDFIDENSLEHNHQILVYDNSEKQYKDLISALPELFSDYEINEEKIDPAVLNELITHCEQAYFDFDMLPPYNRKDIEYLFKFYAQKPTEPRFIPFDEIDRKSVDVALIAQEIYEKNMTIREQVGYINQLWSERPFLPIYFTHQHFFMNQLHIELDKLGGFPPTRPQRQEPVTEAELISIEDLSLWDIRKTHPALARRISDAVYDAAKTGDGQYRCANCGKTSPHKGLFQVDHIMPMSKGGKTRIDNLRLLCTKCNRMKGSKI